MPLRIFSRPPTAHFAHPSSQTQTPLEHPNSELPAYSPIPGSHSSSNDTDDASLNISPDVDLERSTPPPPLHSSSNGHDFALTEHRFELQTTKPHPWLWMTVQSEAPNLKSLPVFVERPIVGTVEVDTAKARGVACVSISVKGTVIVSGVDSRPFFEMSQVLWDASASSHNGEILADSNGKLCGRYTWPFSFTLPREVTFSEKTAKDLGLPSTERLPPSLSGRAWHAGILYSLVVDVKRTGVFATDRSLSTTFGYVPPSFPPRPSRLREIAYLNNTPPPGPARDPDGWTVIPDVDMVGTAFKQRKVTVKCSLAFAQPLAYTRGSVVPLFLTLHSADEQVLDVLAHPHAPIVQMRKKIKVLLGVETAGGALAPAEADAKLPLSRAQWWRPSDAEGYEEGGGEGEGKFRRSLMGEMTLPNNLTPSFTFGKFDLKYVVDMYPFHAAGFEPADENRLSRTEIRVHSGFAPHSPRPRAYLPPGYITVPDGTAVHFGEVGQLESSGFV